MRPGQTAVERWTDSVRGLMLGLALGESVGRGNHRQELIRAGVSTQLAAFTVEGYIRASMRMSHKGICNPAGVIWRAYLRWGMGQGIAGIQPDGEINAAFADTPDGWLHTVPALGDGGERPRRPSPRSRRVSREQPNGRSTRAWGAKG